MTAAQMPTPLRLRATIVCDDFRVEGNGKLMLLGIYAGAVMVSEAPTAIPLCFFNIFDALQPASQRVTIQLLRKQDTDWKPVLSGAVDLNITAVSTVYSVIKFGSVPINAGEYSVRTLIQDTVDIGQYNFSVTVARNGQGG